MPWYPGARRYDVRRDRGYAGRNTAKPITPLAIGYHTAVVDRDDLDRQANDLTKPYPHFMLGKWGEVTQYQDTNFMARADLDGNPWRISIETWDGYPNGYPGYWRHNGDVPPWNEAQLRSLIKLTLWILEQHPTIPRRLARDSVPGATSRGLSWHRLGIDGNFPNQWPYWGRRRGGVKFSNAAGKSCAGDRRIRQVVEVIFPALDGSAAAPSGPPARPAAEIQLALAVLGHYDAGPNLEYLDGDLGTASSAAITAYQRSAGLLADGWWGPATDQHYERSDMSTVAKRIAEAVWTFTTNSEPSSGWTMLRRARDTRALVIAQNAQVQNLIGAVSALAKGETFDEAKLLAGVKASAAEGARGALDVEAVVASLTTALSGVDGAVVENAVRRVFADAGKGA